MPKMRPYRMQRVFGKRKRRYYGPNVQTLIVYLSEEHAVSYQRIKTLMHDMFCIDKSEGTVDNIVKRMTKRARTLYVKIKSKIAKSPVTGAD